MKIKCCFFICCFLPFICLAQLSTEEQSTYIAKIIERIQVPETPEYSISVIDFGARPNTGRESKRAFDKAIQDLKKKGGGTLNVPKGEYIVNGPLHLISNMNLHLEEGCMLTFGTNPDDYPLVLTSWEGTMLYNYSPLIYGKDLQNVAITGSGTLNGSGDQFWEGWKEKEGPAKQKSREMNHGSIPVEDRKFGENNFLRPQLIQLVNSSTILIEGIHIKNAPFWCLHLLKCKGATLRGLSYDSHNSNNDGIDLEYTSDVLIENVTFDNSDDNIAIKAGRDHEGWLNKKHLQRI
ncbi:glycoside hydrolase family 28 protein [Flavimarina sp. Hel_I_48]|uniref:glycoside hydrolase family 28 protein n=1 Tax=Flavimarina sp. Hel_I_48 TaxID=1392488 RepID=UPI000B295604|nr:glycosyl hydrolase family 28 protein [Flavimarina sp. Hel_I_48]